MEVVIDLETGDTKASAQIFSIGAVKFELGKLENGPPQNETFYMELARYDRRTLSQSTMGFWKGQSKEARRCMNGSQSLKFALIMLAKFCGKHHVWGNGSIFDVGILENAYEQLGMDIPWSFRNVRCFRTLKAWYNLHHPNYHPKFAFTGTRHNALDDAIHEAKYLNYYYLNP